MSSKTQMTNGGDLSAILDSLRKNEGATTLPVVSAVLNVITQHAIEQLARLTRVYPVQSSDFVCEPRIAEDRIVFDIRPVTKYGKLILEDVKEKYTQEELGKG